ncbi:MAG: UDP-N-acetylmuramoyl-tripeptide--D-alanyl-D-alanine ligase [Lapillicoccus sp.]
MTLGEIATVVGGAVDPSESGRLVSGEAFVDSRAPVDGGLFVALAGERVDGHAYAAAAVAGGAAGVLASRPLDQPVVVVDDVLAALGRLATHVMTTMVDAIVVGVTGSQGKTTTKDMLGDILGTRAPTVAARESQNNELGVPLTALRVVPGTRYVVSEMGARGMGHIAYLAAIMRPRVGVVLNVGVAHLGEFGSQEGIAAAKGELVEALPHDGIAVLNADDPRVVAMAARTSAAAVTFGRAEDADLRVDQVGLDPQGRVTMGLRWRGAEGDVTMDYLGKHHAMNAAAAAAAALGLGFALDEVVQALRASRPRSKWRMQMTSSPGGVLVVNDTYNANPDSMRAALQALVHIAGRRSGSRTVAVLGEMCELGDTSHLEHVAVGRLVAALGISALVVVGEAARPMLEGVALDPAWSVLRGALNEGDVVLVKASRAVGLEGLAAALVAEPAPITRTDGGR